MNVPGIVLRVAGSTVFAVIGVVADVSAVVLLALNSDVRDAAARNPLVAIAVAGGSLLIALLFANAYSRARTQEVQSKNRVRELEELLASPVSSDIIRWNEFWEDFGRDSKLYVWLKEAFYTTYAWEEDVTELRRVCGKYRRDPIEYYDAEVQESFVALRDVLLGLKRATDQNYWSERDRRDRLKEVGMRLLSFSSEWDYKQNDQAVKEINTAWDKVMDAHEKFMKIAQNKKLVGSSARFSDNSTMSDSNG